MLKTIYIASPVKLATGGTELLQQYCRTAREHGYDARMFYYEDAFEGSAVDKAFSRYENPWTSVINDSPDSALLVPEVSPGLLKSVNYAKKILWWESVDNFPGAILPHNLSSLRDEKLRLLKRNWYRRNYKWCNEILKNAMNFTQSAYAWEYASKRLGISLTHLQMVGDYVDRDYAVSSIHSDGRKNRVLYNPRKGIEATKRIIRANKDVEWVPLTGYSHSELREIFQTSKVYIDFGNHPGKDRLPREAASAGCCVITNRRGSAGNDIDVPIPEEYKFNNRFKPKDVTICIRKCLDNFDEQSKDFEEYRKLIAGEKKRFESEVLASLKAVEAM